MLTSDPTVAGLVFRENPTTPEWLGLGLGFRVWGLGAVFVYVKPNYYPSAWESMLRKAYMGFRVQGLGFPKMVGIGGGESMAWDSRR